MIVRRLLIAIGIGIGFEAILLLFGLHASLLLSRITAGHPQIYWLLNGVYFVFGLALGLIVVRWASVRLRIVSATVVLLVGSGIGLIAGLR